MIINFLTCTLDRFVATLARDDVVFAPTLRKLLTLGIAQASLALPSLNRNFQFSTLNLFYSALKKSIGFARAARQLCSEKETTDNATTTTPVRANTHQLSAAL